MSCVPDDDALKRMSVDELTKTFNNIFIKWVRYAIDKTAPNNESLKKVQRAIALAKNEAPSMLLIKSGPILYKYRERIQAHDVKFFTEINNIEELHHTNSTVVIDTFIMLKNIYIGDSPDRRDELYIDVVSLLSIFMYYVKHTDSIELLM